MHTTIHKHARTCLDNISLALKCPFINRSGPLFFRHPFPCLCACLCVCVCVCVCMCVCMLDYEQLYLSCVLVWTLGTCEYVFVGLLKCAITYSVTTTIHFFHYSLNFSRFDPCAMHKVLACICVCMRMCICVCWKVDFPHTHTTISIRIHLYVWAVATEHTRQQQH